MKLRPQALDCPSCGSSIEVRHAVKTKSVVCASCGSQIDLTAPGFEVLGQLDRNQAPPVGPLRLGMRGSLEGSEIEIVGRIRLSEEGDFWDEWLVLTERGKYLWISEENRKFKLHRPVVPTAPPTLDEVRSSTRFQLDDKVLAVRERGRARIAHLEGELTWKARVGDEVGYVDAARGFDAYGFEWTEDEFEVFTAERLAPGQLAEMFALGSARPAAGGGPGAGYFQRRATVLFVAAALSFAFGWVAPRVKSEVARGSGEQRIAAAQLAAGAEVGTPFELKTGLGYYDVSVDLRLPTTVGSCQIQVVDPGGKARTLYNVTQDGRREGWARVGSFVKAATAGAHQLRVVGKPGPGAPDIGVLWRVHHYWFLGGLAKVVAVILGILGLLAYLRARWERMQAGGGYAD